MGISRDINSSLPAPSITLDTHHLSSSERIDIWRSSLEPLFDIEPIKTDNKFVAKLHLFFLDGVVFGSASFSPQIYQRLSPMGKYSDPDLIYLQLIKEGGYFGHNANKGIEANPGDIVLYDLGRKTRIQTTSCNTINMFIPRSRALEYQICERNFGCVLPKQSKLTITLGNYIESVSSRIGAMTYTEACIAMNNILRLTASAFTALRRGEDKIDESYEILPAQAERICHWIEGNLANPRMSTELICQSVFVSRATLYRIFKPLGGVTSYIHLRRLSRCFEALSSSINDDKAIHDIARQWGYDSYPHFSRIFKKRYGIAPQELRESRDRLTEEIALHMSNPSQRGTVLHDWLTSM